MNSLHSRVDMVAIAPPQSNIFYPTGDGEPVAESYAHFVAILAIFEVLRQYLQGQQATVLANQFLYYAPGFPRLRVAPDVLVSFGVKPGGRDSYKSWEEGSSPDVIFEVTSAGTRQKDFEEKKSLYRDLDVQEYWLFDPKGDWIPEKLRGFRLKDDAYEAIADSRSVPLDLELLVEGDLLRFRHNDTGQILPLPLELARALQEANRERQRIQQALQQEVEARQQEAEARQQEAEARQQAEMELQRYRDRFGALDAE